MRPKVDHRLNRKNVAISDARPLPWLSVIGNLGIFMHLPANSVTDVLAHNRITVAFSMLLNCPTNVTQVKTREAFLDSALQTFFRDSNQLCQLRISCSHRHRSSRVTNKAAQSDTHID